MPRSVSNDGPPASVLRVPRASTVDLIAIELRNAIYAGALRVGKPLGEIEISAQLGVSRSPLREAAQRLVQEGLLTATPGRGLRVATIDKDGLADLYEARVAVESQALRLIVNAGDPPAIAALKNALADLVQATHSEDARTIGDADLHFHRTLVEAAGNRRLTAYMATLIFETRIASYSMSEGYVVRGDVSPSYQQLIDALHLGDLTAAIDALETQLAQAVLRLHGELDEQGVEVDTIVDTIDHDTLTLEPLSALPETQ